MNIFQNIAKTLFYTVHGKFVLKDEKLCLSLNQQYFIAADLWVRMEVFCKESSRMSDSMNAMML